MWRRRSMPSPSPMASPRRGRTRLPGEPRRESNRDPLRAHVAGRPRLRPPVPVHLWGFATGAGNPGCTRVARGLGIRGGGADRARARPGRGCHASDQRGRVHDHHPDRGVPAGAATNARVPGSALGPRGASPGGSLGGGRAVERTGTAAAGSNRGDGRAPTQYRCTGRGHRAGPGHRRAPSGRYPGRAVHSPPGQHHPRWGGRRP